MNKDEPKLQSWWRPHVHLFGALSVAIIAALAIVAVAYFLYWRSPNRKYDIDRGDSSRKNQVLDVVDQDPDTTSPVDVSAAQKKLEFLEKEIDALSGLNKFDPDDLSDQNLQLSPNQQQ